jgi:hypothetical protein
LPEVPSHLDHGAIAILLNRSAFVITLTDDKAIAAAATTGESNSP